MSLAHLQAIIRQVHCGTNNAERSAAQQQLTHYEKQAQPRDVFVMIRSARDSTVLAFLLAVLEKILLDRGESLQPAERVELRNFVLEFAVSGERANHALDRYVLNKVAKIIVDCVKLV
jgi:hypothetical protein